MLTGIELEFERLEAHFLLIEPNGTVTEMLYQDRSLGRTGFWHRLAARMAFGRPRRRIADLDILSMNDHLRRDLGLGEHGVWPK